ncbi:amidase signature domain-containing protein [Xylogone sp. PMI_703]|nr:amidase signature domain-containing protein [Xylogone sp. PMI_703]
MAPSNKRQKVTRPWQEIAKEAQDHRDASLAKVKSGLPDSFNELEASLKTTQLNSSPGVAMERARAALHPVDVQITEMLPEVLIADLASGKLSATDVTTAFLRRAVVAQILTNCITELLPERALARAKYLDDYFAEHKKPIGPLHGLPISVKEMIGMKELGLNAGYVAWWGKTASEDAHVLQILWDAGAVFYARTTQPQSMMHLETDSNLYGVTVNPYNREVSAGGSSGGEGALIGMRGSCLGIGSDIGGSIRSPAANCGIYGFKPTAFRIPTDGWCSTMAGADAIPGVIGPMSTSLEGIKIFMQVILGSRPWIVEPALIPIPWVCSTLGYDTRLKIGIMWHDNVVTPHPPITRALKEVTSKLKALPDVEVVDWKPHLHDEAWAITSSLYFTDGGAADAATITESGEPWRPLTTWMLKENPCVKKLTPQKLYYWQEEREAYRKEYAKAWNDTATGPNHNGMVDVILCPVGPGVAPAHNTAKYWGYTSQWNLLDYPAIVFPVTKVDPEFDLSPHDFQPLTELDADNWKLYDAHKFASLPVSLQLVGRRFEDEKVLAILEFITEQIGLPFVKFP